MSRISERFRITNAVCEGAVKNDWVRIFTPIGYAEYDTVSLRLNVILKTII